MATDYLALAKEAYEASTSYADANLRPDWDYSIKTFRMEHAAGSRYLAPEYQHRSRIVSPKTRSVIRKNEAAAMHAMFANREIVNVEPGNPDSALSAANAACMKELLEYRLSKTIPAYEIYLGGLQDAQTTGTVCSYQYWEYEERGGRKVKDRPCIELRPVENLRLDAGASWIDPVNTSPYFCDIIPMYVVDVRSMMESEDPKTGAPKWKKLTDEVIVKARPDVMDSTRAARLGKMLDPYDETPKIGGFDVVWVMRWFMRLNGADKVFYTLGTEELLTEAKDIEEVYFHGKRPYAMGYAILESHRAFKSSMPVLLKHLHTESTGLRNQRADNVSFVLNKRWMVARGRQTDVQSLVRNVPGGVTLTTDPNLDIKESNWPDVTSSAFVEHDRLNAEMDDLAGNFSPSTRVANNAVNDTLGGSKMASAGASLMSDYLIRTVNETWWSNVLRQLALLEQHYETDEMVLGVCASKAKLMMRFGMSRITDLLLTNEVVVTVDAGMGDPSQRFQKFMMATQAAIGLVNTAPPGFNVQEGIKEIYANAGYRNGERFFGGEEDPRLVKAIQMLNQMRQALEGKQMEIQASQQTEAAKIASAERIKAAELQIDARRIAGDQQLKAAELATSGEGSQTQVRLKAEEQAAALELERNKAAAQLEIEFMKADAQVKLQGLKQTADQQTQAEKLAFEQKCRAEDDEHKARTESMPKIEQAVAQSFEAGFGQLQQTLQAILDVLKNPPARQIAIGGIQMQKDAQGNLTGVAANVKPTLQ